MFLQHKLFLAAAIIGVGLIASVDCRKASGTSGTVEAGKSLLETT